MFYSRNHYISLKNPDNFKSTWNSLTSKYTDNIELVEELWQEIEGAYSNSNRHYHNMTHLESMINNAFKYKDKIKDLDTILFSIFYHDIIYDIKSKDNEEKSAEFAVDRLSKLGLQSDKIVKCRKQIIATKNHNKNVNKDTNYLLDFDLAILGDTPQNYREYTMKIRKEYAIYPDFIYKNGRKKVIQYFLNMDNIFKTEDFQEKFEKEARDNLTMELERL